MDTLEVVRVNVNIGPGGGLLQERMLYDSLVIGGPCKVYNSVVNKALAIGSSITLNGCKIHGGMAASSVISVYGQTIFNNMMFKDCYIDINGMAKVMFNNCGFINTKIDGYAEYTDCENYVKESV